MYMKLNSDNIAIIVGFFIVLFIILFISGVDGFSAYHTPYSKYLIGYPYEGFHGMSAPYSTYLDNKSIDSGVDKFSIEKKDSLRKIRGFDGLYPSPNYDDSKIDHYLQLPGSLNCEPGTLSNSKGYLCLGPNERKLLTTRGGNATGNNFEQSGK